MPAISHSHPILLLVGTRPEAIKLASVARELERREVPHLLVSTGQHREMLQPVLDDLELVPDRDLEVMRPDQSLAGLSARVLKATTNLIESVNPSWVVVQGDTTTVAMASLAAFYQQVPVAHVEAGLRTHRRYDPFPEEVNRRLVAQLATRHFAPTAEARENLRAEGVFSESIEVTGNTVIDALYQTRDRVALHAFADLGLPAGLGNRPYVLVTAHRRENLGEAMRRTFAGLRILAERYRDTHEIVYPVHLNPRVAAVAEQELSETSNIRLMHPVGYRAFVKLLTGASLIVTDSGGVQEEATALGVPTLVTRTSSERPEAMVSGVAQLVGTDSDSLVAAAVTVLEGQRPMPGPSDIFGDGRAGHRIVDLLLQAKR